MQKNSFTKTFLALFVAGTFNIYTAKSQDAIVHTVGGWSTNYIPKGSTSTTYVEQGSIYDNGNIGIGTNNPGNYKLYVNGNTYTFGTITGYSTITGSSLISTGGIIATGAINAVGLNNNNGSIVNAGSITGAVNITASGTISGAAITASGLITSAGLNNNNGGITNAGAISGASLTASSGVTGATVTASSGDFNTTSGSKGYQVGGTYILRNNNNTTDIFVGANAGNATMTGHNNSYVGFLAGTSNATGTQNVAVGSYAGRLNQTGSFNTLVGYQAGYNSSAGNNTFIGYRAGFNNGTGINNTCIGNAADMGSSGYSNASSFGNGAVNNQGSNTIYFGSSLTGIYSSLGTLQGSDARFKFNVSENVKGLEFIKKLRPVTYQMDTKKLDDFIIQDMPDSLKAKHKNGMNFSPSTAVVHSGFLAQEVEKAARDCGFKSSIVSIPANPNKSHYSLNYAELVVPLVKAVQELSASVDNLQSQIARLKEEAQHTEENRHAIPTMDVEFPGGSAILFQNMPNPFGDGTVVKYFVPENSARASLVFFDESGREIKSVELPERGVTAELHIVSANLPAGVYSYSMIVNGKVIDTKKMLKAE